MYFDAISRIFENFGRFLMRSATNRPPWGRNQATLQPIKRYFYVILTIFEIFGRFLMRSATNTLRIQKDKIIFSRYFMLFFYFSKIKNIFKRKTQHIFYF